MREGSETTHSTTRFWDGFCAMSGCSILEHFSALCSMYTASATASAEACHLSPPMQPPEQMTGNARLANKRNVNQNEVLERTCLPLVAEALNHLRVAGGRLTTA